MRGRGEARVVDGTDRDTDMAAKVGLAASLYDNYSVRTLSLVLLEYPCSYNPSESLGKQC